MIFSVRFKKPNRFKRNARLLKKPKWPKIDRKNTLTNKSYNRKSFIVNKSYISRYNFKDNGLSREGEMQPTYYVQLPSHVWYQFLCPYSRFSVVIPQFLLFPYRLSFCLSSGWFMIFLF